jgi:hypothetical protein
MFLLQVILGIILFFLFEAQKYLHPKKFSFLKFWLDNRYYLLWCLIVGLICSAIYWIDPKDIVLILSKLGIQAGEFSGIVAGWFLGGISKRIGKNVKIV